MFKVENKTSIAKIYLFGDIVDDEIGGEIKVLRDGDTRGIEYPSKFLEELNSLGNKELEVHINSYGGSVFAGVAIANFIANHKAKTTCIVDGVAASIASQIFFSADVCKIPTNGYLMIHRPFSRIEGDAEELRKAADILDTLQAGLETTYQRKARAGVTAEDIHKMLEAETWFTGKEAAQKFEVELISPIKALNYANFGKSVKAMKEIPLSLAHSMKVHIVLTRMKGLILNEKN